MRQYAEATLGGGSLRKIVKLPEGEDENEWLAVNSKFGAYGVQADSMLTLRTVVDFYNHINLLYGSITEFCSPQSCPEMKATDEYVVYPAMRLLAMLTAQVRVLVAGFRELQASNKDASSYLY